MKEDNNTQSLLREDLIQLMKKHGIRNASFCGTDAADCYHGLMCVEETSVAGIFESAVNIGRLWQHTRTVIRRTLDDFERVE